MSHRFFAVLIQPQYAETVSLAETLGEARRKCPILGGLPKRRRNSPLVPTDHFHGYPRRMKTHKKDNHTRRGLMMLIGKRRGMLKYIKERNIEEYRELIKKLGIRDNI